MQTRARGAASSNSAARGSAIGHAGAMSKRKNGVRASVRALSAAAVPADVAGADRGTESSGDGGPAVGFCREDRGVGFHGDHLHGPDGRVYRRAKDHIRPNRAQELLQAGAAMAVDVCGCRGYCGLDWPSLSERTELGRRPPRLAKNRFGWLDEWQTDDGHRLLLQYGDVRWP